MSTSRQYAARERALRRVTAHLERHHYPRLAMLAILALAGAAGFLTSAGLLHTGVRSMGWRYGFAAVAGYLVFLLGLRLWLAFYGRRRSELDGSLDAPDPAPGESGFQFGGGGGFRGGGAGGPLEGGDPVEAGGSLEAGSTAGDAVGALGSLDEGAPIVVPVLVVGALVVGLAGVVAVLMGAPGLLAELLLDGVIAGAAYRRLRYVPVQHWLTGAVRRTWKPMLALAVCLVAAGLVAQWLVPAAGSIGDVFRPQDTP